MRLEFTVMILQKRIPKDFYKLFRTQNMQYYMLILVALYEENTRAYMSLGLTDQECRIIISETISKASIQWAIEVDDTDEVDEGEEPQFVAGAPASILTRLVRFGWLKKDYDEKLNRYVYSFPEYSQLYIELFHHLQTEDDSRERESILSIYSALYTFHGDKDKNNDILKSAVITCRKLSQLLTNMQDGMRNYFDILSKQKNFIGIQAVLVDEINNSDSKKYAILTTSDSFYRYKEAIKEMISDILIENELRKENIKMQQLEYQKESFDYIRMEQKIRICDDAGKLVHQLEREVDIMEQKYKKLIDQKAIFAKRALARMHYILQEGNNKESYFMQWIHLLNHSENPDEILRATGEKMCFTSQYKLMSDQSFSNRKQQGEHEFKPEVVEVKSTQGVVDVEHYIPKPLYTKKELRDFQEKNMENGTFITTKQTVDSVEDLEKLMFLWQEATENTNESKLVELGQEIKNEQGMSFSKLTMIDE